ncbi:hypothetical protein HPB50_003385 [Hyalomma asiaticum]|uniref:Uncharacterized protein n=1 Tax=Hyalomma asiaticum TaxID=266040 RepID=A0ACB7RV22_HYAAI|nr:hypothetical protein HPB50_003385 [Hyalomma asiaticum]
MRENGYLAVAKAPLAAAVTSKDGQLKFWKRDSYARCSRPAAIGEIFISQRVSSSHNIAKSVKYPQFVFVEGPSGRRTCMQHGSNPGDCSGDLMVLLHSSARVDSYCRSVEDVNALNQQLASLGEESGNGLPKDASGTVRPYSVSILSSILGAVSVQ